MRIVVGAIVLGIGILGFCVGYFPEHAKVHDAAERCNACEDAVGIANRASEDCRYSLDRTKTERNDCQQERDDCQETLGQRQIDLKQCEQRSSGLESQLSSCRSELDACNTQLVVCRLAR